MKDRTGKSLTPEQVLRKTFFRIFTIYTEFTSFLLRLTGYVPSHLFRRFIYRLAGIKIGRGSTIHMGANFFKPSGVRIGQGVIIGDHCFLDGRAPLKIGDHADIASEVLIYNAEHDINDPHFRPHLESVEIGEYSFIGPRAIILPGVKIGRGAIVAAGAVVTRSVPDFTIVGGIPARKIGERQLKDPTYRLGRPMLFQ